jgi:hypothetical protein
MSASSRNDIGLSLDAMPIHTDSPIRISVNASPTLFHRDVEHKEAKEEFLLPFEVDIEDLKENGRLYPAAVIQAIEEVYADLADNKYSKTDVRIRLAEYGFSDELLKYAIIKKNHKIYLVYKGETWSLKTNQINPATDELKSYLAGKGNFGKVKDLQEIKTGEWLADKITSSRDAISATEMQSLDDLGLNIFHETYVSKRKGKQSHLVQRYLPHFDLYEALKPGNRFYNNKARFIKIFLSMALRVHELHQLGYIHCDIKPENFRLNALTDEVQLVDTGLSVSIKEPATSVQKGTPSYMAPEVKQLQMGGFIHYTEKVDVYSLAQTFFALLGPYWRSNKQYPDSPYQDDGFSRELWANLIAPMRKSNAQYRYSMATAIHQLRKLEKIYPLDSSHREVDIQDFFTSIDQQEFIKALFEFPGVIDIIDKKSEHTLKEHYEFQRALYAAGIRVGRCAIPAKAQIADNDVISNAERKRVVAAIRSELNRASEGLTVLEIEKLTALKNALANDEIKLYAELLSRFRDCIPTAIETHKDAGIVDSTNLNPAVLDEVPIVSPEEISNLVKPEQVKANVSEHTHPKKSFFSTFCGCLFSKKSNDTSKLQAPLITNRHDNIDTQTRPGIK